ncbi:MAG: NifU N-terminal domain-containing protein [Candidatus Paceibacterota bacterium]
MFKKILFKLSELLNLLSLIIKPNVFYVPGLDDIKVKRDLSVDPDMAFFHVSEKMVSDVVDFYSEDWIEESDPDIVRKILYIKGIKSIVIAPYEISIEKSPVFSWKDLISPIEKFVIDFVKKDKLTNLSDISKN